MTDGRLKNIRWVMERVTKSYSMTDLDEMVELIDACEPFLRAERCLSERAKDSDLYRLLDHNFDRGASFEARDFRRLAAAIAALTKGKEQ